MSRIAVVSGATGGIGVAVALTLAGRGYQVFALGRSSEKLAALRSRLAGVVTVEVELDSIEAVPDGLAGVDHVNALVHCAGISEVASVEDTRRALWEETFAANVTGPAALTRALLPALRAGRGHVVFVNAAPGLRAVPNWSAYTASKAALRELADSLREEEEAHGVRVTSIYPGGVRTELLRKVRHQLGRPYDPAATVSPETLASLVATVLEFPSDAQIMDVALRAAPSA
ncbi:MAG: SDR family oxidoreductase [Gaiellaceae bacterium]